jgi:hypothetical protein
MAKRTISRSFAPQSWDVKGSWAPYTPSDKVPWNLRRVIHLHRAAGFAATWKELQRDLADGPGPSISRLLAGRTRIDNVSEEFESIADLRLRDARDIAEWKAWWFFRIYHGPDPLGERLTLLWHNHFATSNLKVQNVAARRPTRRARSWCPLRSGGRAPKSLANHGLRRKENGVTTRFPAAQLVSRIKLSWIDQSLELR